MKVLFEGRVGKIVEALDIREADGIVSLGVEPGAGSGPLFDPAANSNRSLRRLRRLLLPAPRRLQQKGEIHERRINAKPDGSEY